MIYLNHDHRLDEVPINGVAHPGTSSLDFKSTSPLSLVRIDLVEKSRYPILTVKDWPLYPLFPCLATLNIKSKGKQIISQHLQNLIACQSFVQVYCGNRGLVCGENPHDARRKLRWWLGLGK